MASQQRERAGRTPPRRPGHHRQAGVARLGDAAADGRIDVAEAARGGLRGQRDRRGRARAAHVDRPGRPPAAAPSRPCSPTRTPSTTALSGSMSTTADVRAAAAGRSRVGHGRGAAAGRPGTRRARRPRRAAAAGGRQRARRGSPSACPWRPRPTNSTLDGVLDGCAGVVMACLLRFGMEQLRVVVLDDYQRVAEELADWRVAARAGRSSSSTSGSTDADAVVAAAGGR